MKATILRRVLATASVEELVAATGGRYLVGPTSLSFIVDPKLVGAVVWGRPSTDEILALVAAHEQMRPVLAARTSALVDVRLLEWPDPAPFAALVEYLAARGDWLAEYIDRLAVVRPAGPVGAASVGFFDVSARPFAVEAFTDLEAALKWIGRDDAGERAGEIDALAVEATGTPALLRRLRERLDARPGALSLEDAARVLGVSARSLQRSLKSWRTSFQVEQNRSQVRVAMRLLRGRDVPLAEVAREAGCASLSHFSALFRRITGEAPSAWRDRHRQ